MTIREASHAGSWYTDHGPTLSNQLKNWLEQAHPTINGQQLPTSGARVIIAPYVHPLLPRIAIIDHLLADTPAIHIPALPQLGPTSPSITRKRALITAAFAGIVLSDYQQESLSARSFPSPSPLQMCVVKS